MTTIRDNQDKRDQRTEYWRKIKLAEFSAGAIRMRWRTWKIAMAAFFFIVLLGITVIESRALFANEFRDGLKHLGLAFMFAGVTGFLVIGSAHIKLDELEDGKPDGTS